MPQFTFHPHIASLIKMAQENPSPPLSEMTPEEARAARNPVITGHGGAPQDVTKVEEHDIDVDGGKIKVRVYTPAGDGLFAALVYFHGGGWVVGNIDTHDSVCRALANESGCVIASVDYRLSPENKYPAAAEDCYVGTKWVADNAAKLNCDPARIGVGGDSCGGNLSAVVCLMAAQRGGPEIKFQLLVYPCTDVKDMDKPTYKKYWDKLILTGDGMTFFTNCYVNSEADKANPYVSPLLAEDVSNQPPALVITAEHDVLTSDGELYHQKLLAAGVESTYSCYPGMIHLFFGMAALTKDENGIKEAAAAMKKYLG